MSFASRMFPYPPPPLARCGWKSLRRRSTSAPGSACADRPRTHGRVRTDAYARIGGLRFPARRTLGSDIAGVVHAIGPGVTRFRPGDEVYGDNLALKGGFAQYALAPELALAHKPTQLTFAEASTIPQAGAIAWQGTHRALPGNRVLINGAGGGSGSFAIQLAKRLGAHVTGVDNAAKQDFMRSVAADDVIDYGRDDFTRSTRPYDLSRAPVSKPRRSSRWAGSSSLRGSIHSAHSAAWIASSGKTGA